MVQRRAGLDELPHHAVVAQVRGEGLVWGIECAGVGSHAADAVANACVEACYLGDSAGRAIRYVGRDASAAPAPGSHKLHVAEQEAIVNEAMRA